MEGEALQVGELLDANRFHVVDNPSHTCADSVALAIIVGMGFFFLKGLFYKYVFACMCAHCVYI